MKSYIVSANDAGQRFDKYLKKLLSDAPNSFLYKMLRKKNIVLNGKRADGSERLSDGDEVKLFLSDDTIAKFTSGKQTSAEYAQFLHLAESLRARPSLLPVVYEDADTVVFCKPAGMLSQKAKPDDISANEYLLAYLIDKGELTEEMLATFRPSICNRLDRNTSGLLVAGKTLTGLQKMSAALKDRTVQKYYRCIVAGEIREPAHRKGYLIKSESENQVRIYPTKETPDMLPIETSYRPIRSNGDFTELEVHLITGRSHQIRAQLAADHHPIVGDPKYGDCAFNDRVKKEFGIRRQILHAYRMEFLDGRVITAPTGKEFERIFHH